MASNAPTPANFSRRAGSNMPGRVRRALDGGVESRQRFGNTMEIAPDGRQEVKTARGGGLKQTPHGLALDPQALGEKNLPKLSRIAEPISNATLATAFATLRASYIELLDELRRNGYMRGSQ